MYRHVHRTTKQQFALWIGSRKFHNSAANQIIDSMTVLEPVYSGLQYAHAYSGLEWHTMIPLTAVILRTVTTLPLSILARLRSQKQARLRPLLSAGVPIMKARLASSPQARDGTLTVDQINVLVNKENRKRRIQLFKKYNCQVWKNVLIQPGVQIPLWVSLSLVLRSMTGRSGIEGIPVQDEFRSDSFLWYSNLTEADPYGVLPMFIGLVSLSNMEWNSKYITGTQFQPQKSRLGMTQILTNAGRFGVIFFISMTFQMPVGLCLYWLASNIFSLAQNILLQLCLPISYIPPKRLTNTKIMEVKTNE